MKKVLVFNTTGDRDASRLLPPLLNCNFDVVIFCPNIVDETGSTSKGILSCIFKRIISFSFKYVFVLLDQINMMVTKEQQLGRCEANKKAWLENANQNECKDQLVLTVSSINGALQRVEMVATTVDHVCTKTRHHNSRYPI